MRKGVVKNHSSGALLLSFIFSWNIQLFSPVLFFFFSHKCSSTRIKEFALKPLQNMLWWRKKSLWSYGNVRWVLLKWKGKFANEDYGWCKVLQSWRAEGIWCKGSCQKPFLAQCNFQVSTARKKSENWKRKNPKTQWIQNLFYKHNLKHFSLSW